MTKRNRLTKSQDALKQRILSAYRKPYGFMYTPPEWDKNLWKKKTSDIYDYIEGRFHDTMDVVEYYSAMVFLWKTVPNAELLVEFHKSPQWTKAAQTYNHPTRKQTSNRKQQKATEPNKVQARSIKNMVPMQIIGETK